MAAKVKKPKTYVQPRIGMFAAMAPLEAWVDESAHLRYVEIRCNNRGSDLTWSAMTHPEEIRRLGSWLLEAAAWVEAQRNAAEGDE